MPSLLALWFIAAALGTLAWIICSHLIRLGRFLGLLATPGDELLEPLRRENTRPPSKKKTKPQTRKNPKDEEPRVVTTTTTSTKVPPPPKTTTQPSLKALKKGAGRGHQRPQHHHHDSPRYRATLLHDDDVTGVAFADDRVITACRDRTLRVFTVPGKRDAPTPSAIAAARTHLVKRGALDVAVAADHVVVLSRAAGGEPALVSYRVDDLDAAISTCEKIFRPKSKFEPLKLVAAGRVVVAASSDPRVAVFDLARDGTLASTSAAADAASFDTSSIVNHDVCVSPDGSGMFAVATFSADVPIFKVERGKLKKVGACVGAKLKVRCVAWSPCSRYIAAASEDMMLRVFDVTRASGGQYAAVCTAAVPSAAPLTSLCWVEGGLVGASAGDVFLFDGKEGRVVDAIYGAHTGGGVVRVVGAAGGRWVSFSGTQVRLWE